MSTTREALQAREQSMLAEIEPLTLSATLGYGRRVFGGAEFAAVFGRLTLNPDGSKPDIAKEANNLMAWLAMAFSYAEAVKAKAEK